VVEERGELRDDLFVERCQTLAQLRAAERRHADLGQQHTAVAIGGVLDEEEVQPAGERALRVEHVELGAERGAGILDDLIDGRDQEVFFRDEIVVDEPGRQVRLGGDALHRCIGNPVLQDGRTQALDDLPAARSCEARATHR
jgi:hypothetical protein